jgi:SOS response regulatory protein OraA/RecX
MSDELKALIERARRNQMTPQEIREQVIDFAYGNGYFEDQRVTREGIARAAAEFDRQHGISSAN